MVTTTMQCLHVETQTRHTGSKRSELHIQHLFKKKENIALKYQNKSSFPPIKTRAF